MYFQPLMEVFLAHLYTTFGGASALDVNIFLALEKNGWST